MIGERGGGRKGNGEEKVKAGVKGERGKRRGKGEGKGR